MGALSALHQLHLQGCSDLAQYMAYAAMRARLSDVGVMLVDVRAACEFCGGADFWRG